MELKPGTRLKSAVCDVEAVVVRPPSRKVTLECGGHPMVAHAEERPQGLTLSAEYADASPLGKRYQDEDTGLEALCSKGGAGSLSVEGRKLTLKDAKKLPSSD